MEEFITERNIRDAVSVVAGREERTLRAISSLWIKGNSRNLTSPEAFVSDELEESGLIRLPLTCVSFSGGLFVRNGRTIPIINTTSSRGEQNITAFMLLYYLIFEDEKKEHIIRKELTWSELYPFYFASKALIPNISPYYTSLGEIPLLDKVYHIMAAYSSPYRSVLMLILEKALREEDRKLENEALSLFASPEKGSIRKFPALSLDSAVLQSSNTVSTFPLDRRISEAKKGRGTKKKANRDEQELMSLRKELRGKK